MGIWTQAPKRQVRMDSRGVQDVISILMQYSINIDTFLCQIDWEFTCPIRKWKLSSELHYKRALGPWASQLCSGVRGDSTLFWTPGLWTDFWWVCFSIKLAYLLFVLNKCLIFVCSEPCAKYTWSQNKSFPGSSFLADQGAGSAWAHRQPTSNMPNIVIIQTQKRSHNPR